MPLRARSSTHRSTSSLAATAAILQATRRYVHELGIVTTISDAMPAAYALCCFGWTRAGARHSEQHHPPPSSRTIKPTPARLRCLAGCHEFSAVGFVSARGAAARDEARRDAVRSGGVGFAGVAERGGWRGARGWFLMHARLYAVLEKLIQAPAMLMRFSHPSQGEIYGGNSAKLRVWVIPSSSR